MRLHVFADEMHAFPHWILANEADGSPIATISQNVENQQQVAHDLANSVNRESDLCDHVRILRGALTTAHAALGRAASWARAYYRLNRWENIGIDAETGEARFNIFA